MVRILHSIVFSSLNESDFGALNEARQWCREHGYSVGHLQRGAPCGLLFGEYDIQKWRNLSHADREALHGLMRAASFRTAPVTIEIFDTAPRHALSMLEAEAA